MVSETLPAAAAAPLSALPLWLRPRYLLITERVHSEDNLRLLLVVVVLRVLTNAFANQVAWWSDAVGTVHAITFVHWNETLFLACVLFGYRLLVHSPTHPNPSTLTLYARMYVMCVWACLCVVSLRLFGWSRLVFGLGPPSILELEAPKPATHVVTKVTGVALNVESSLGANPTHKKKDKKQKTKKKRRAEEEKRSQSKPNENTRKGSRQQKNRKGLASYTMV